MKRLNSQSLSTLGGKVEGPAYERGQVSAGIVHLGIGAFHRAHMAAYVDAILADDPNWGIIGASLRRPDTKQALEPQDFLYTLVTRGEAGDSARIIGSVLDIIDASRDTGALVARMARPDIRIVSLTVTEKGYCRDSATGGLDRAHPDIVHDLARSKTPRSIPGVIVAALAARRAAGHKGFTVLSCDNLQDNGRVAGRVVAEYAALLDPDLAGWIDANVRFPSTMVDRIVPATRPEDRAAATSRTGLEDNWPVITEAFSQWVVEDDFIAGRPRWEAAGVQMTADVAPFEQMKLRMLNGSHSAFAYLGSLCGLAFVNEAATDPALGTFAQRLMTREIIPTLSTPGVDLAGYRDALLARFANPSLQHRLAQIAMDGSQKLTQRLVRPALERHAGGQSVAHIALALAGWMAFVVRAAQNGGRVEDPLADRLAEAALGGGMDAHEIVARFVAFAEIFPDGFRSSPELTGAVSDHLATILADGARAALAVLLAPPNKGRCP